MTAPDPDKTAFTVSSGKSKLKGVTPKAKGKPLSALRWKPVTR